MDEPQSREPDPALRLLWRHQPAQAAATRATRRGPRQRLSIDAVVDAAVELADREGLQALTMRRLAQHLELSAMAVYTYVPGRAELLVLMTDQAVGQVELPEHPADLRERLARIARLQFEEYQRHPWLLEVTGVRPWLGPHMADRYEWQLSAVEGLGLEDLEMDQSITLLVGFAAGVARSLHESRRTVQESGLTDAEWWEVNGPALGEVMAGRDYPLAGRVGSAAGEAYQAASDQHREFAFGLERILDGLVGFIESRR